MKYTKINIIILGVGLLLSACNKEEKLNPVPTTLISDQSAYDTPERIQNLMNGIYSTFKGGGFFGAGYIYYTEAKAGNFVSTNLNPTRGSLSYQMVVDAGTSDISSVWTQGYQIINACNVFIENMQEKGAATVSSTQVNNYIGEARFLRGLAYYYLVQLYAIPYTKDAGQSAGLPLRLTGNKGLGDYNMPRSKVADVYAQIIDDLNFAEQNLPSNYSTPRLNTTRAHKNSAIAAKTRVYLSMGKYPDVITEANKIVSTSAPFTAPSGVAHALQADVLSVFKGPYTTNESIFSMPFSSTDVPGTSLGNAYLPDGVNGNGAPSKGTGDFYLLESGVVADPNWTAADKRRSLVFVSTEGAVGRNWCVKYSTANPYIDYVPVIRYAEVLLSLAEALANENGYTDTRALALLNAVRQRSDAATTITASSTQDLIDKIVQERNIEFLGEGIRNSDLMRLGKPIPAKLPTGGSPVQQVDINSANYIWPIPNTESLYNNLI